MRHLIAFLRTIIFKTLFFGLTALFMIVVLFLVPFMQRNSIFKLLSRWCAFLFWMARFVVGFRVTWRNLDVLPEDQPFIMSSKHESTVDAFTCVHRLSPVNAIAKQELFSMPLLGPVVKRLDLIPVRRGTGEAHKTLPDMNEILKHDKRPIMIFPEGTRVNLGEKKKLKFGAFHVQEQTKLPIYTVASNAACFWAVNRFTVYPGEVIYDIHPEPIEPGLNKEQWTEAIEGRLFELSDALRPNWCAKTLCDKPRDGQKL